MCCKSLLYSFSQPLQARQCWWSVLSAVTKLRSSRRMSKVILRFDMECAGGAVGLSSVHSLQCCAKEAGYEAGTYPLCSSLLKSSDNTQRQAKHNEDSCDYKSYDCYHSGVGLKRST